MTPDQAAIASSLPYLAAAAGTSTSASLRRPRSRPCCSFPLRRPPPIYLTCAAFPYTPPPCAPAGDGQHMFRGPPQPRCSNVEAVGDVAAAVPDDYTENTPSSSGYANGHMATASSQEDHPGESTGKENHKATTANINQKMVKISDKLIGVFMVDKPTPTDWRKLLAFSREWDNIRPHFFKRCQERADAETNPEMKHGLLRLARKLKEVDEDVQRHNELFELVKSTPSGKIGDVVAKRRKDFTVEFFNHLYYVAESYKDDPAKQKELATLGNDCVDALQAHDDMSGSLQALNVAELKLKDILNSPSVDAACRKIDDLAEKKELDSALVLMLSKAWSAAKGTDITKSDAKDIMFHLYMTAVANLQRQMPKDIRILKHLIMIEDPAERLSALNDAFTPGPELQGENVDTLFTSPEVLHTWASAIIDAYYSSREGTLLGQARDLMNPKIIKRVEELVKTIKDQYL
ncbi:hypothetical protein CFC21_009672 [Triticum aestivum]|nr:uncharacterized protein At4g37920 [Aegilops tauschii subsp. strangulata]XP_044447565.1 uncharacterized protein At4g37920-like [Triticum aestivum]KAF6992704.1 hypothetical protein CFC21_009672 [Triticum aestivum]